MPVTLEQRTTKRLSPGAFFPLGATPVDGGVNFALWSRAADEVWLLLYDDPHGEPTDVIRMPARARYVWNVLVDGIGPGQLYGYRVRGPFDPAHGQRFNEHKLLVDPYARALSHKAVNTDGLLLAYDPGDPRADLSLDARDNGPLVPKGVVVDAAFDWQGDAPPMRALEDLVIYEAHLKGFTAHPSSGVTRPGTYAGLVEKIPHLVALGVGALELLPVHESYTEDFLLARGLTNYWGYNTLGYFAPESSYRSGTAPGSEVAEFKTMVRELHRAGIELILDVVYNHTAEGSHLGPTLSLRGIDNAAYYDLDGPDDQPQRFYANPTGCGNALDFSRPAGLRLVMDSLRYWVGEMHVDGFRFDLASVLGRQGARFEGFSAFFDTVQQDPMLSRVKLIAEPWDCAEYELGNFPVDWSEWNGRFRDTVRRFVKSDAGQLPDLAQRVAGSSDLYADDGRSPYNSINFVTCHDGFTLHDLVAYGAKHNEANREDSGTDANDSWNCGAEGETADPEVLALRARQVRNIACLLLFSAGTPMVLGGDEMLRTQHGNNNAYCQDNATSWFDWTELERHADVFEFVRRAIAFRRQHAALRRRRFYTGRPDENGTLPDISWFAPGGDAPRWDDPEARTLVVRVDCEDGPGDVHALLFVFNAAWTPSLVRLPSAGDGIRWRRVIDTMLPPGEDFSAAGQEPPVPGDVYEAGPRSTVVLVGSDGIH